MFLAKITYWYSFIAFSASWVCIYWYLQLRELWTSLLRRFSRLQFSASWQTYLFPSTSIVCDNAWRSWWEMCRLEGRAKSLFISFPEVFCKTFRHLSKCILAWEKCRSTYFSQILYYEWLYFILLIIGIFMPVRCFLRETLPWLDDCKCEHLEQCSLNAFY